MNEWIAFVLPPAVALVGARLNRVLLGKSFDAQFGAGLKFALGLAVGMLVFSQAVFFAAFVGVNAASTLAWLALLWGGAELVLAVKNIFPELKDIKSGIGLSHLWWLLLLPVIYGWWIFGKLSTLEGTLEFDAAAFWVFKSKIFYLTQGQELASWFHNSNLAYMHWYYPTLTPSLYTLGYGAVGGVNEFVNKVWPFWMLVALSLAILSLGRTWKRPHPLPILTVMLLCFLPALLHFIRQEGGTMPMIFYTSLSCLMIVRALYTNQISALAVAVMLLAGCAATKLEGAIYAAVWAGVLLPIMWRRGWLKLPVLWKAVGGGIFCLVPYAMFRLAKPVTDSAADWWQPIASHQPGMMERFTETWFLGFFGRFFSPEFFQWSVLSGGGITLSGHWTGLAGLWNDQLAVLPWLTVVILLFLTAWPKIDRKWVLGLLSLVMILVTALLALVIAGYLSGQSPVRSDFDKTAIDFSTANQVGRYYCPLFIACFLSVVSFCFLEREVDPAKSAKPEPFKT